MKFGNKIGGGKEKNVFEHPDNPDKVIAKLHERWSENKWQFRGRFYLSKILHVLFPKNIPDVHLSAQGTDKILVSEMKNLDPMHQEIQKLVANGYWRSPVETTYEKKLESDPCFHDLTRSMAYLGIYLDTAGRNFGYDDRGNLIYVDNDFSPWGINLKSLKINFNFNKENLLVRVNSLPEEQKEKALLYLNRIEDLAEEDLADSKSRNKSVTKQHA